MTPSHNDAAHTKPLTVGLIGDAQRLRRLGPGVQNVSRLIIAAQAGLPQAEALAGIPWIDDTRVLIGRPDLEAVLIAAAPGAAVKLAAAALERDLPVWRPPPLGRDFAEATEAAKLARRANAVCRVASWWEHLADELWNELAWPDGFEPLYSEIQLSAAAPDLSTWVAGEAGGTGGVLANDGYPLLEALVAARGLPESVLAATGCFRCLPPEAAGGLEDTAVAILRYAGAGLAVVRATWNLPAYEQRLGHHGRAASVTLDSEEVALLQADGSVLDRRPLPGTLLERELSRFADLVRGGARDRAAAPLERHVAVSALLEAIYLAARTAHPESPRRFYEAQGWPAPRS